MVFTAFTKVLRQERPAAAQNGRVPLAERGRLVDSAKGMCEMPRRQCQNA